MMEAGRETFRLFFMPTQLELVQRLTAKGASFPRKIDTPETLLKALQFSPSSLDGELRDLLRHITRDFGVVDLNEIQRRILKIPQTFQKGTLVYV